jgi:hypothetical protein
MVIIKGESLFLYQLKELVCFFKCYTTHNILGTLTFFTLVFAFLVKFMKKYMVSCIQVFSEYFPNLQIHFLNFRVGKRMG